MGVPKRSRKGKKAWRKNIDTQDVEEAHSEEVKRQRKGPAPEDLPDQQLFFVDQVPSVSKATARQIKSSSQHKDKKRKLLHSQVILQAPQAVKPVKTGPLAKNLSTSQKQQGRNVGLQAAKAVRSQDQIYDAWGEDLRPRKTSHAKLGGQVGVAPGPPPELPRPGMSYNPEQSQHEDVLADAVAAEVSKANRQLLKAAPPPKMLLHSQDPEDELALLQVEEEGADEEDQPPADASHSNAAFRAAPRQKPRAQRNKERRLRELEQIQEARRQEKQQKQDIQSVKKLKAELAAVEAQRELRRRRRAAALAEKLAAGPARLGKLKYQPPPIQVLLSEELGTSLRSLHAAPVLVKERFKALQRRGLIEPRLPVRNAKNARRIFYQTGDRQERYKTAQAEIDSMRKHL